MGDNNGLATITIEEYERLLKRDEWLGFLEQAGVDNWSGYEYAHELRDEQQGEE